jgi:HSP20 family protein
MKLVPFIRRSELPTPTRFFEEFFNEFPFSGSFLESKDNWSPSVDIMEKDGNLIFRAELPGLQEKDIELKLEGNILTLKGERKMENENEKGTLLI